MPRLRRILGLALLAATALGVRAAVVVALAKTSPRSVTYEHGEIAKNLLAGRGFAVKFLGVEGPTSQQAPLYPALLAACYRCFGVDSPGALLAMQGLQCLAGAGLAWAVVWLAWSLVPERPTVGWVAGWGAAVYPTHVYMVTHIQIAIWAALCLTLLVAAAASPRGRNSWLKAAAVGALAGVLLLIEPILALVLPLVAWMFWRADLRQTLASGGRQLPGNSASAPTPNRKLPLPKLESAPSRWPHLLGRVGRQFLIASVAAITIAPWLWRNGLVHGEPVFIKSTFGYAFWQGNNPASWGADKIPKHSAEALRNDHDGSLTGMHEAMWEARHETLYIDDVLLAPGGYREFAGLSEPERSRLLFSRACDFIRHEPARYFRLCLRRLQYFLLFDETNPKAANRVYRIATVTWLVLAFTGSLALAGLWRRLWPTWAMFALVTLFHSLTIVSARFRIPIEPISFVWAAAAVAPLIDRLIVAPWVRWRARKTNEDAGDPERLPHPILQGPHRRTTTHQTKSAAELRRQQSGTRRRAG